MSDPFRRPTLTAALFYRDPLAALDWLEKAFGFERSMVVTNSEGRVEHSEMKFGDGLLMIGSEYTADMVSPAGLNGKNTQTVHVQLQADLDGHCARARAAGAVITREPADQFYGDRVYAARDPEGHVWSFGQTVRQVSREEMEQASGLKIDGWM